MTADKPNSANIWILPTRSKPYHLGYSWLGDGLPIPEHVRDMVDAQSHPDVALFVSQSNLQTCTLKGDGGAVLIHVSNGDPRSLPNATVRTACPIHGQVYGPAILMWRAEWGVHDRPLAVNDILCGTDRFHVAAWILRLRHNALNPAFPNLKAVANLELVLRSILTNLCSRTMPWSQIGLIREAETCRASAHALFSGQAQIAQPDPIAAAEKLKHAADLTGAVLLELSRTGANDDIMSVEEIDPIAPGVFW